MFRIYQYFKRQLKTPTCFGSFGVHLQGAPGTHTTGPNFTLPNTDYAHKNITSNFSEALLILPEDGSQRIRNMSEFLIVF